MSKQKRDNTPEASGESTGLRADRPPLVFLSYAHEDEFWKDRLRQHLDVLAHQGDLEVWDDRDIRGGEVWNAEIEAAIDRAQVAVVLISKASLSSDFICNREVPYLMDRRRSWGLHVLPLIVWPCAWTRVTWVGELQCRPRDGRPLSEGSETEIEKALTAITEEVSDLASRANPAAEPEYKTGEVRQVARALEVDLLRYEALMASGEASADEVKRLVQRILGHKRFLREGPGLVAGDVLGDRYRIGEPLGRGGFATVWKAFDRKLQTAVAVKVLHGQYSNDESRRSRFFRGARQMARLDHPAVVRVIEADSQDRGYCYFVMEYLSAGDLQRAVLTKSLDTRESLAKVLTVGEALVEAHEQGLVHRDVKPANILLDNRGRPKLADFDLVHAPDTTGGTGTESMLGTVLYMSPEAMKDAANAGHRADQYSLAMTAAFALYGEELPLAVLRDHEAFLQGLRCPEQVKEALLKATSLQPEERYDTVAEFLGSLRAAYKSDDQKHPRSLSRPAGRLTCEHCGFEIGRETLVLEIRTPDECRCPACQTELDWLSPYSEWIRFNEEKSSFVIYALEGSPVLEHPLTDIVELGDEGAIIDLGELVLKVLGLPITKEALKCRRLTFFRNGEALRKPDLPVRGEFYGLVSLDERTRPILDRRTGDYNVQLFIEGWDQPVNLCYKAEEIHQEEALLLSWPNFTRPNWNVYYYLLEATPQMFKAGMSLRALQRRHPPEFLASARGRLTRPLEAFEIVFGTDGEMLAEGGLFETTRFDLKNGQAPTTVALDVGTDATSACYRVGDGASTVLRFRDFTETLIPHRKLSNKVLSNAEWLPTYRLDDPQTATRNYRSWLDLEDNSLSHRTPEEIIAEFDHFLPSSLLLSSPANLEMPLKGLRHGHSYATNPHGRLISDILELDSEEEIWFRHAAILLVHLEGFLLQALATILNREPRVGHLKLRVSFPRAISKHNRDDFVSSIHRALAGVEDMTGIPTNQISYLDETTAVALSVTVAEGFCLVLDMGGEALNLGLFERLSGGKLELVFFDHLAYGGNSFLRMLASPDQSDLFPEPREPLDERHRLSWLQRRMKLYGFDRVVEMHYRSNINARKAMLDLLVRFYSGMAYYVRRLFQALTVQREALENFQHSPVTLCLIGDGWSLADALPFLDTSYGGGHESAFSELLQQEGFTNLIPVSRPKSGKWPSTRTAVGYGTLAASERRLYRSIADATGDRPGIETISGFDFYLADGSTKRQEVSWHQGVPLSVKDRHYYPVLSQVELPEPWKEFIQFRRGAEAYLLEQVCSLDIEGLDFQLTRSPLARFLEHVYLAQLPRARRY